ncbi:bifunctional DNA primase/polymerase [Streptomyces sp. XY332]|uniref:bifunctional DNA primase/polymerase n=1 Tax=Streptomyces sp. XY332 TaxID=1415561 RepID=UPI0003C92CB4|nr:bifunctional DNA primase/polymerase [Streptomyces sp. XY332]AGZ93743.1 bifunctional DNA primase/polymerase [Streptomyces sp. XY332]KOY56338.1 DNA primase [Streptomyces sp. XY332]
MSDLPTIDFPGLELLAHAVATAERGWHVFPLRPQDKRPAGHPERSCPGTGRCTDGHRTPEQRATTDPDLIAAAWTHAGYNIGIATGPSGLLVVDLDMLKPTDEEGTPDGVTAFEALCERAGQAVPTTYRVRTARGGMHLYFTQPDSVRLGNTAGRLGKHIDTRGWGGYVVAPGSSTPDGAYTVIDSISPVPLPGWLAQALARPKRVRDVPMPMTGKGSRYARAALDNEVRNVAHAGDGTRNDTLLRAARALGRFIASGDLSRMEVEHALRGAAAGNATESERYYEDVIARGLDWSIANNPAGGRSAA